MNNMLIETLGWLGSIGILVSHSYVSVFKRDNDATYYGLNLVASLLLTIISLYKGSYFAVALNVFWMVVSGLSLAQIPLSAGVLAKRPLDAVIIALLVYLVGSALLHSQFDFVTLSWLGTITLCWAFLLLSAEKIDKFQYLFYSTFAALFLMPQLYLDNNLPMLFLEICWFFMSGYSWLTRPKTNASSNNG